MPPRRQPVHDDDDDDEEGLGSCQPEVELLICIGVHRGGQGAATETFCCGFVALLVLDSRPQIAVLGFLDFFHHVPNELAKHMIEKVPPDLSKFLLSPMPGLLVRLTSKEGDEIKAGEELAVVEAMKMENSLRANEDVVIAKVLAAQGESLVVDQPILEFE